MIRQGTGEQEQETEESENKKEKFKLIFKQFSKHLCAQKVIIVGYLSTFSTMMTYICGLQFGTLIYK